MTDVLAGGSCATCPGRSPSSTTVSRRRRPPADFAAAANTPGPGQTTLTAAFGTLTNAGPNPGTVRLTYRAIVANVLSNQANTSLANSAVFSFSDPGSGGATVTRGPATTSLVVGEPFLALTKALLSSPVGLAAGSTASYTVTVGNTGTTTAFETVITDALPAGLFFPGGTVVTVTPTNLSGQPAGAHRRGQRRGLAVDAVRPAGGRQRRCSASLRRLRTPCSPDRRCRTASRARTPAATATIRTSATGRRPGSNQARRFASSTTTTPRRWPRRSRSPTRSRSTSRSRPIRRRTTTRSASS